MEIHTTGRDAASTASKAACALDPRTLAGALKRPTILSVFDGRVCVGFVFPSARGSFGAFTASGKPVSIFPTMREAAAAIPDPSEAAK